MSETNRPLKPSERQLAAFRETTGIFPKAELGMFGGEIPVMYAGWGDYLTTDEMIARWGGESPPEGLIKVIKSYGVTGGYFYGDGFDRTTPEAHEQSVIHMTAIAETLMKVRGWNHASLRTATISEHPKIALEVAERLRAKGLAIDDVVAYGLACDGGGGAMIDALADLACQGQQMVFVSGETLSGKPLPRRELFMSTLFGNGGGGAAFIPGKELSLVHPNLVRAVIKKDDHEVIQIPRVYDVEELAQGNQSKPPPWYTVDPNANFYYGQGLVLNEMTTAGEYANMKRETGAVFKELVVPLAHKILNDYYDLYPDKGDRIWLGIFHQPSHTIVANVGKNLQRFLEDRCPKIPWLMEPTGFNNISSGNIFIAMTEAARLGLVNPADVFLLGTFGIGMSAHMAVVQMKGNS